MASRPLQLFTQFSQDMGRNVHQLFAGGAHTFKIALTNQALSVGSQARFQTGLIEDLATGNGYTTGGKTIGAIVEGTFSSGRFRLYGTTNPSWTASGDDIGPWRYAVLYNDSVSSPVKPCVGFWDYGPDKYVRVGTPFTIQVNLATSQGILIVSIAR